MTETHPLLLSVNNGKNYSRNVKGKTSRDFTDQNVYFDTYRTPVST